MKKLTDRQIAHLRFISENPETQTMYGRTEKGYHLGTFRALERAGLLQSAPVAEGNPEKFFLSLTPEGEAGVRGIVR